MAVNKSLLGMANLGEEMLASGKVTPLEVQTASNALRTPQGQDWLSNYLSASQPKSNPYTLAPMEPKAPIQGLIPTLPEIRAKTGAGKQAKTGSNTKADTKTAQTKNLYADADEYAARIAGVENLPFIQEQKQGLQDFENMLSMAENQKVNDTDWFVRPLLALSDSQTGSKLLSGYQKPETQSERSAKLLSQRGELQKRQGDLSKQILDATTKMKEGTETNSASQQLAQMMGYTQGMLSGNAATGKGTTAQEAVDRTFAKDYDAFILAGGYAEVEKNIRQMSQITKELGTEKNLTGPEIGIMPKAMRDIVNPKSSAIQDRLEGIVQQNLRAVLGAQFTDAEGTRLIQRAYNPRLSQAENANRVRLLEQQMLEAARAKARAAEYYETHGTLRGYNGSKQVSIGEKAYDLSKTLSSDALKVAPSNPAPLAPKAQTSAKRAKPLDQMTDAELLAYEKSLKGGA